MTNVSYCLIVELTNTRLQQREKTKKNLTRTQIIYSLQENSTNKQTNKTYLKKKPLLGTAIKQRDPHNER